MRCDPEEWKKLCDMVADEADPKRLTELVEQLIGALDARKEHLEEPQRHTPAMSARDTE